jgi:Icc-related predicted phosphoesterase
VRILHVTDFHGETVWFDFLRDESLDVDVICLTGDLIEQSTDAAVNKRRQQQVLDACAGITIPLLIATGNHDSEPSHRLPNPGSWLSRLESSTCHVDPSNVSIGGIRFGAIAWGSSKDRLNPAVDVILAHAPPAGLSVGSGREQDEDRVLRKWLEANPGRRLVLSGHVHQPRSWHDRIGNTLCLNPGRQDGATLPNRIRIDISTRLVEFRGPQWRVDRCAW